jgi:hypothetical protein
VALDKVFPDARFVMTHRDVRSVLPSVADLHLELHKAFSNTVDPLAIGKDTSDFCELSMRRMIAFRDAGAESRFFDIYFAQFQADPYPSIEALYAFLGEEFSDKAHDAMEAWRQEKPLSEQGYTRTAPAVFGFDLPALHEKFRFYSERFGLEKAA